MKSPLVVFLTAAVVISFCQAALAVPNPLVYPAVGGIATTNDFATNIAMDKAVIDITLKSDEAHVKAVYTMRNTKDAPVSAFISLPEKDNSHKNQPAISNISFTADKEEVKSFDEKIEGPGVAKFTSLHTVKIPFTAGQTRTIIIEYDCPTFIVMRDSGEKYANRTFNFVMFPGDYWSGNIKQADIRINLADDAARQLRLLKPAYATWEKDTVEWQFKDIAPDDRYDIQAVYGPEVYKNMKLKPGKESVIAVLKDPEHPQHNSIQWMAFSIGTKDIVEILHSMGKYKNSPEKLPGLQ